jgi:hypothetical protein
MTKFEFCAEQAIAADGDWCGDAQHTKDSSFSTA